MKNPLNHPLTLRSACLYIAILALATALGWGGWTSFKRITGRPPSTAEVRDSIWDFIETKTGESGFKPPVSSSTLSNSLATASYTNAKGRVKTVTRIKRGALGLPETSLSVYFRTNQEAAGTYEQMFRLIGEQLTVAEHLLESDDLAQKQSGLVMASEASAYARNNAINLWLAARICEGFLWPNLATVEGTNQAAFAPETLLNICDAAFKEAEETNNIIRNYEYLLKRNLKVQQADAIRFRLARLYEETGQDPKALAILKQITTFKTGRVAQQIAAIEQRLKSKR